MDAGRSRLSGKSGGRDSGRPGYGERGREREIVELIKRVLILATLGCTLAKHTHTHTDIHIHTHTRSHTGPHTVSEVEPCCLRAFRICWAETFWKTKSLFCSCCCYLLLFISPDVLINWQLLFGFVVVANVRSDRALRQQQQRSVCG